MFYTFITLIPFVSGEFENVIGVFYIKGRRKSIFNKIFIRYITLGSSMVSGFIYIYIYMCVCVCVCVCVGVCVFCGVNE